MPIPFTCPHCGLDTLVDDEYVGQRGPCASCGKEITVPYQSSREGADTMPIVVRRRQMSTGTIVLLVFAGLASAALVATIAFVAVFPAIGAARTMVHKRSCESNLIQIGLALRAYEAKHGTLPPAYIPDANGKPMHSWRVLLLPFLAEQGLHSRYDFNEPWDGPNNAQLTSHMPAVYGCPADPDAHALGETSYMVITGAETFFPDAEATSIDLAQDDLTTSILVVETQVSGVTWLNPRDLKSERMQYVVNGGFGQEMGSHHREGAHVLLADGAVLFLDDATPADYIEGMATMSGDEPIRWDVLDQ
ncbi:MAG: DUF1559 domain-containing protein [Planctomycetota bacterium]|nr:DUF1559 domain-containing protein [Planctomycetota bacterium]